MVSNRPCGFLCAVVLGASVAGCSQSDDDAGPSYAESLVTYNAELEALDRLEAKREKLIKEFAAATAPKASGDNLSKLEGLLKSVNDLKDSKDSDPTSDPEAILDNVNERGGEAREVADQLLDGLLSGESNTTKPEPTPEEAAAFAERKAAFESELASLDAEISKQQKRVERARQVRDAAEAKSQSPE